jgi:hypothetical protein
MFSRDINRYDYSFSWTWHHSGSNIGMQMVMDIKEATSNQYGFKATIALGKKTPTAKAVIMRGDWTGTGSERYSSGNKVENSSLKEK